LIEHKNFFPLLYQLQGQAGARQPLAYDDMINLVFDIAICKKLMAMLVARASIQQGRSVKQTYEKNLFKSAAVYLLCNSKYF